MNTIYSSIQIYFTTNCLNDSRQFAFDYLTNQFIKFITISFDKFVQIYFQLLFNNYMTAEIKWRSYTQYFYAN